MMRFAHTALQDYVQRLLAAAETPAEIAATVAASLVDADLKGVESHGILRVPHYLDLIRQGYLKAGSRPTVVRETAVVAMVDAHQGFGHFALRMLCELVAAKAAGTGIAFGGLINTTHTGRIGWFAEHIVAQGQAIQILGGGAHRSSEHTSVAPFGGRERILSTNPITVGWPGGRFGPVVADFSTSTTAEGKVRFYRERGQRLPPGWILNQEGVPSRDPDDLYAGGAILTMGDHKGYGLSLFNEFLGGILLGTPYEANWAVVVIDANTFADPETMREAAESLLARIKASPPAQGHTEVLLPGERETTTAQERMRDGIPVAGVIWDQITAAGSALGVEPPTPCRSASPP